MMPNNPTSPRAAREFFQAHPKHLKEYQRNSSYVCFLVFICSAALVYLTGKLRDVLLPLVWAAFFAMPLTGFISTMDLLISRCLRQIRKSCKRCCCRPAKQKSLNINDGDEIDFRFEKNEPFLRIQKEHSAQLLKRVNEPASEWCGTFCSHLCKRRIRIKELYTEPEMSAREVNRFVEGWKYYVEETPGGGAVEEEADEAWRHQVHLSLYLDKNGLYPAIIEGGNAGIRGIGKLMIDTTHTVSNALATLCALVVVGVSCMVFGSMLSFGVDAVNSNVHGYIKGGQQLIDKVGQVASDVLPNKTVQKLNEKANGFLGADLPGLASEILEVAEGSAFQTLLFLLYLLFWTFEPLPVNGRVSGLINTFLLQKSLVCLIFASLMGLLLYFLKCKLWPMVFVVAFLLNYVPEVGPIVCFIVTLPLVILDGNLNLDQRFENAVWFSIFFLIFKFVTGNVIEVQLYAKSGGDLMRMHPVVLMASMMLFDALMGPTGMFMTVPLMASLKYYMLTAELPPFVLDPLLTIIEGSEHGPHMNYVEMHKATKHAERMSFEMMNMMDVRDSVEDLSGSESDEDGYFDLSGDNQTSTSRGRLLA